MSMARSPCRFRHVQGQALVVPSTPAGVSGNLCPPSGLPPVTFDPGIPSYSTVVWFCGEGIG